MSNSSTKYPCVAAGYCNVGRFFSCTPSKFCHRVRTNLFSFKCILKPGLGRWVGLQHSFTEGAGALAAGLLKQPHCGEPDAGPYCIAKPTGLGAVCEVLGAILSILYGGYMSVLAIESPGGDDDTQWLTFWLVQGAVLSVERFFMRPILSNVSMYYEVKLCLLIWLMWFNGAERAYRRFRRFLIARTNIVQSAQESVADLEILEETGKALIRKRLKEIHNEISLERQRSVDAIRMSRNFASSIMSVDDWQLGWEEEDTADDAEPLNYEPSGPVSEAQKMKRLSDYVLSPQGGRELMNAPDLTDEDRAQLLADAQAQLKFEPKYLYVRLIGTVEGPEGELPAMDDNGFADPYVTCRLVKNSEINGGKAKTSESTQKMKKSKSLPPSMPQQKNDMNGSSPTAPRTRSLVHGDLDRPSRGLSLADLGKSVRGALQSTKQLAVDSIEPLRQHLTSDKVVKSRILYRTKRPQWNEELELSLGAGYIDENGTYHNDTVQDTSLCLEVWDADIEFWGFVLRFSPIIMTCMGVTSVLAYVTALSDHLTDFQNSMIKGVYLAILALLAIAYVMVEIRQADDDAIGQSVVPLKLLMDKGEHSLRLTLKAMEVNQLKMSSITTIIRNTSNNSLASLGLLAQKEEDARETDNDSSSEEATPTNDVGGYGVLRVKLMLAET